MKRRFVARASTDAGFGLIEQLIAMVVVVGALLGLLTTLGASAQGIATGRQRTIAVSLAKQVIERLQGAAYTSVAMDLASIGAEPLILGTAPDQTFEGERIVAGGTEPYRTLVTSVGTTFSIRTFVTAVPTLGAGYRRVSVIVDWPADAPRHTMRFSSLVFPLDYTSYPASSGAAEAIGGMVTVTGTLAGDIFDDVHVVLPGVRADTNASTLRTSIGAAASATSFVDVGTGPIGSLSCEGVGTDIGECSRQTLESVADNDSSSTTGSWVAGIGQMFAGGGITTPGGTSISTPAGTMTSRASTDECGPCGFGDGDGVPWSDATATTTTGSAATFASDHGVGVLAGSLWRLDGGWSLTAAVDHDPLGGGIVTTTAQLTAPSLRVFELEGAPVGFDGAVKVSAFTARASVLSGYTLVNPDVTSATTARQVQLWVGDGYRTVTIAGSDAIDTTAIGTVTVGDHIVTFTSRVQSQPSTFSAAGTTPRTDAAAQHPSMLLITVDVTITSASLFEPTTTTTPTTTTPTATTPTTSTEPPSTTATTTTTTTTTTTSTTPGTTAPDSTAPATTVPPTTVPPTPLVTDRFTVVFDYGRVSAHDTWLAEAP